MSAHHAHTVHVPDWRTLAARYDRMVPRILPESEAFFGCCTDFVPQGHIEILELGGGTGYATERLLKHNPRARVTCLDLSAEMLAVASAKPALKRVQFVQGDIRDGWPSQRFDVVFTTLCLHHLANRERLAAVRRVFGALRRGGCFINGDVFRPGAAWEERLLRARWFRFMRAQGLTPSEARAMLAKRRANQSCLDTTHGWRGKLQRAGFTRILNPLTIEFYAVFVAYK